MHNFIVPVGELLGHPGEHRELRISEVLPQVGNALARLDNAPLVGELRAESVMEGILITGRVEAPVNQRCARCLREFESELTLEVCELFASETHERSEDEDTYPIAGAELNLEPMLRDAVGLALPLNPLCRADCKGLCARCGADLNEGDCSCAEDDTDPRWAALDELRARLTETDQGPHARSGR